MSCGISGHGAGVAASGADAVGAGAGAGCASAARGFGVSGFCAAGVGARGSPSDFGSAAGEVARCCTMAPPKNKISNVKGSAVSVALRALSIRFDVIRSSQVLWSGIFVILKNVFKDVLKLDWLTRSAGYMKN
jgi:hypothetical protein